jgi:hypothetical protein
MLVNIFLEVVLTSILIKNRPVILRALFWDFLGCDFG